MSVTDRLKRLTGEKEETKRENVRELRRRIDAIMSRRRGGDGTRSARSRISPGKLKDEIEGEEIQRREGAFFLARRYLAGTSFHGYRRLNDLATLDMRNAALLASDRNIEQYTPADAFFLDTETTGLSGGTGTIAFLIGCGWFEDGNLVTEQLFMRDFREERAALSYLIEIARDRKFLVTFNGKTFDIGLLSTRFIMNRLADPLSCLPHLDLLHPSRRLVGHRLPNSRLGTIEEMILRFYRDGDIPGSEIPQRYFDWLRYGDPWLMKNVFEHNRLDVVSLAALAVHLSSLLGPSDKREEYTDDDILATARLMIDRGYSDNARRQIVSLLECCTERLIVTEAKKMLSLIHKRDENWDEAVALWESILTDSPDDYFACEELAKWLEHRRRDYSKAACLISRLLNAKSATTSGDATVLAYRLKRLNRKLGKT
ncbi:MAG: ribonuclease H-like domain-containing protein [Deltaproteobacteria bacterium]|nr:ribonuclease H-like domain-containing protein [Deltaproteobacteria bacterium]